MNLFIVKKGALPVTSGELDAALATDALYDQVAGDYERNVWDSACASVAFACIRDVFERVAPRRYVHHDDHAITFFDGLPIDTRKRFKAHDAAQVGANWRDLDEYIDGFFAAVKIDLRSLDVQVQTDLFGVYKVFCWTDGKSSLISNSLCAIEQLVTGLGPDIEATGLFLTMALVPGEYTLLDGVKCLPGGRKLSWSHENARPTVVRAVDLEDLLGYPGRRCDDELVDELSRQLVDTCEAMGLDFPDILCPLTGGKDSRLLAVLLHEAGVSAHSYTYGNALGDDGRIALKVAEILGIDHDILLTSSDELIERWSELSREVVRRGAGMCPLQLATGAITARLVETRTKSVRFWGAGSSICRAPFFQSLDYVRRPDLESIKRRLLQRIPSNHGGLVSNKAVDMGRSYIQSRLQEMTDRGARPLDVPDILWFRERGAARSGKNMRTMMDVRDSYSPFFGRAFVSASLSLDSRQRATEPLHFRLIRKLRPEVLDIPFDKGAWKHQNAHINLLQELGKELRLRGRWFLGKRIPGMKVRRPRHMLARDTMFERTQWLRVLLSEVHESFNDPVNEDLWGLVNRKKFNELASSRATSAELAAHVLPLFTIGTILKYREERVSD